MGSCKLIKILLILFVCISGILMSRIPVSATILYDVYKDTITLNASNGLPSSNTFSVAVSQTVYYSCTSNITEDSYLRLKNGDTVIQDLSTSGGSFQVEANVSYTIEAYGGNYHDMLKTAPPTPPYITGYGTINFSLHYIKLGRYYKVYAYSPFTKFIQSFTPNVTTIIHYKWGGDSFPPYTILNSGYFKITNITDGVVIVNKTMATEGQFQGIKGKEYKVEICRGEPLIPSQGQQNPGQPPEDYATVEIYYDDISLPEISVERISNLSYWVKIDTNISLRVIVNNNQSSLLKPTMNLNIHKIGETPTPTPCASFNYRDTADNIKSVHFYDWSTSGKQGQYKAYVVLKDDNGSHIKTYDSIFINVDSSSPVINNLTLSASTFDSSYYKKDSTLTINYNVQDDDSGLDKITTLIHNDNIVLTNTIVNITDSGTFTVDLPQVSGTYTLTVTVFDKVGNSTLRNFSIVIDKVPPVFTGGLAVDTGEYQNYTDTQQDIYTNAQQVTYSWPLATDDNFDKYLIKIESSSDNVNWQTNLDWTSGGVQTSYQYSIPANSNGKTIKASVKAVDMAGNDSDVISKSIVIDQSAPDITQYTARYVTGSPANTGKAIVQWDSVNDNINGVSGSGSGIERYETAITETQTEPGAGIIDTQAPVVTTKDFTGLSVGKTYYLWIRAVDKLENHGNWTQIGPFPNFNIFGPGNNQTVSTATFNAQPRQPLPGGKELRFKLKYKLAAGSSYHSYPADYQTAAVTPNLGDGTYSWYLEIVEYQNGTIVEDSDQTTEVFTFTIDNGNPVSMPLFYTTPGTSLQLSATVANSTAVTNYHWDLGDGTIIDGLFPSPEHYYPEQLDYHETERKMYKEYPLTLTVTYNDGSTATGNSIIRVQNTEAGVLKADETWSGNHEIWGTIIVPEGITLVISPGTQVIVRHNPGETGYNTALIINGTLNAYDWASIVTAAGTLNDGWKGIFVNGKATFNNVWVQHALCGVGVNNGADVTITGGTISENNIGIHVYRSSPTISNTEIRDNRWYGIKEDEGNPAVSGCAFSGNGMNYYDTDDTRKSIDNVNDNLEL